MHTHIIPPSTSLTQLIEWAGKVAQQGKVSAAKPNNLSSVLRIHMKKMENRLMKSCPLTTT